MCSALYSLMALGLRSVTALYSCGMPVDSLQLTALGTQISLSGNEWQRHPILTCAEALCILGVYCLRRGYFKEPKKGAGLLSVQLPWRWRKLSSCLPCPVYWRALLLWGCSGLNKRCQSLLQGAPSDTPCSHPDTHLVTREPRSDQ